jgi:hypothetical protein
MIRSITRILALAAVALAPFTLSAQQYPAAVPVQRGQYPGPGAGVPASAPASSLDDRARFLAGLPLRGSAPFAAFQETSAWDHHVKELDELYVYNEKIRMQDMRSWAPTQMHPRIYRPQVIYYTFAGPDFISVDALFPEVPVYILSGLEPVGSIVAPETMTNQEIEAGLANLQKSLENILKFSYFITKDMKVDFERTKFNGVLPILYVFLARGGKTVVDTQYVAANADGSLETSRNPIRGGGNEGVRITFTDGRGRNQELYYFKTDLSNGGISKGFFNFMGKHGKGCGYLKSASYLLHEPSFTYTRDWLLNHSATILQDDSGVPFRNYDPNKWNLTLYGQYSSVLDIFQKYYQPDLQQAYQTFPNQPLTFGVGYTFKRGQSNLLLATLRK